MIKERPLGSRYEDGSLVRGLPSDDGLNPKRKMFDFGFRKDRNKLIQKKHEFAIGQGEDLMGGSPLGIEGSNGAFGGMYNQGASWSYSSFLPGEENNTITTKIADALAIQYVMRNQMKTRKWKSMTFIPEVSDILDGTCNEIISKGSNGDVISLEIDDYKTGTIIGEAVKNRLQKEFSYLMQKVMRFDKIAWSMARKFLTEGRVFWEIVYDDQAKKIVGFQQLPAHSMFVIVRGDEVVGYRQVLAPAVSDAYNQRMKVSSAVKTHIDYSPNQIMFWDYEQYGLGGINDPMSFLEFGKKAANQLVNIEDAIVRYRIKMGHEKRVFKIDTSSVPADKSEAYMRRTAFNLNRKMYYSRETGEVIGAEDLIGMSEDFYVPVTENSKSDISTLPAGANVGEITDLLYFRDRLYRALKYPKAREMGTGPESNMFGAGKNNEVMRSETKFCEFVSRIQDSLSHVLIQAFVTHLETLGEYSDDIKCEDLFSVRFNKANNYQMFRDAELWSLRFEQLEKAKPSIWSPENPSGFLAPDFVYTNIFRWTDQERAQNELMLEEHKKKVLREQVNKTAALGSALEKSLSGGSSAAPADQNPPPELGDMGGMGDMGAPSGLPL